jgi:hypothetical protein
MMAVYNRKWASGLVNGSPNYARADVIVVNGRRVYNPTDSHYRAAGFLPVVDEPPGAPAPEGKHYEAGDFALDEQSSRIVRQYSLVADPPPPPRTFSKLKCVAALMSANVWPQVKAYIEEAGLYDLYLAAQNFAEDNEYFTQGRAALQTALGWTDAQVEAILAASVAGEAD